jgi:hypothetical protein
MPWRFLKFVSQPEEHTKPSDTSAQGSTQAPWPSESARHPSRLPLASRAPVPQEQRVLQLGIVADPSTLCIALAACVGELFDLSGLRLQPRTVSMN